MKLQLKRSLKTITNSTLAQAPSVDQMEYGEIAVNYVSSDPSLFLKDSTNVIRKLQLGILPDLDVSTEQSGTLDGRYILNTGDTLTGNLSGPSFIGGVARMSAVAPASAEDGELWWNNNDGRLYIYYNDGVTTQWVDASPDSFTLGAGYYDKNEADARFIGKAGGIMTGILQLAGNPATSLAAAPKQYVDGQVTAAQTASENFTTAAIAAIPATDLSAYDTSVQVDAKISAIPATDLSSYDTSAQVDAKIAAIPATDLSNYDTSAEVNAKILANNPDLSNYSGDISTNGSATFASSVQVGGTATVPNSTLYATGGAFFKGPIDKITSVGTFVSRQSDTYFRIYNSPQSLDDFKISLNNDGSATFEDVTIRGESGASGKIKLNCENNSHGVMIEGPAHAAGATYTLTLPPNTGNPDQVLTTDGTGSMTWSSKATLSLSSLPALP